MAAPLTMALGPARAAGSLAEAAGGAVLSSLMFFFVFFAVRVVLRRAWLAAGIVVALGAILVAASASVSPWAAAVLGVLRFGGGVAILTIYGVLPMTVAVFVSSVLERTPFTTDLSDWYASSMLLALGLIVALTLWSFRAALGGRRVWKGDLLES